MKDLLRVFKKAYLELQGDAKVFVQVDRQVLHELSIAGVVSVEDGMSAV